MKYKLKSTGEIVEELPWEAPGSPPWSKQHVQVLKKGTGKYPADVQIVRKDNLIPITATAGLSNAGIKK